MKPRVDYLSSVALFAAHGGAPAAEYREPLRSVACVCGYGAVARSLRGALDLIDRHLANGTEACDHAVSIDDIPPTTNGGK